MSKAAPGGFTIVFRVRPIRGAMGMAGRVEASVVQSLKAERVFNDRVAMGVGPASSQRGELYVAPAGDFEQASRLLERLNDAEEIVDPYIAPDRDVLVTREEFHRGGSAVGSVDGWHKQIRLDEAKSLPQWTGAKHEVSIAVVDSGIDLAHPQLEDFAFLDHLKAGPAETDKSGHGSHVSGLVAARFDSRNGFGSMATGCAKATTHRALTRPHDVAAYYRALRAAAASRVINLSTGGEGEDPIETELIADAIAGGSIVVAAIGNHAEVGNPDIYPAILPGVIAVGAVDADGNRASFSNYGDHILVSAPGVDILSTVPTYAVPDLVVVSHPPLAAFSGTSMAAPIVTAIVLRMLAFRPDLTRNQVIDFIQSTTPGKWNSDVGRGVIDVAATLSQL